MGAALAGAVAPLVQLLRLGPESDAAAYAAACLWDLCNDNAANAAAITARPRLACLLPARSLTPCVRSSREFTMLAPPCTGAGCPGPASTAPCSKAALPCVHHAARTNAAAAHAAAHSAAPLKRQGTSAVRLLIRLIPGNPAKPAASFAAGALWNLCFGASGPAARKQARILPSLPPPAAPPRAAWAQAASEEGPCHDCCILRLLRLHTGSTPGPCRPPKPGSSGPASRI